MTACLTVTELPLSITGESALRVQFFDLIFGNNEGFICIATSLPDAPRSSFKQHFFSWPDEQIRVEELILQQQKKRNVWFCVNLLDRKERKKDYCLPTELVWADLDECAPTKVVPTPSIVIESSPGRFQALWRLESKVDPFVAEDYSRRIAYQNRTKGADVSGWDLTQLLRVPLTRNFKYDASPRVRVERALEIRVPNEVFEAISPPDPTNGEFEGIDEVPVPDITKLPTVEQVLYKHSKTIQNSAFVSLFTIEPDTSEDWSRLLWRFINVAFECDMSAEEVFVVANEAKCNKYKRDDRPIRYLWRDILKAQATSSKFQLLSGARTALKMPDLELDKPMVSILDDYCEWAQEATDAVPQFHELSAFILLSSLCASSIKLGTSYGPVTPNLWGLVLGDSTLTRKTTAMQLATGFIADLDREIVLATDGSAEGLLTGLSTRPNKVSMFYKDEVTGFFDSINRKDYLAGMPETLTALYDVPPFFTRRLRKETINIENPVFIFFGGGIKDKVHQVVSEEYILSGFLPRFLIVSGETDMQRLRRTGPLQETGAAKREKLLNRFADLYEMYGTEAAMNIGGQNVQVAQRIEAFLTKEAWELYGDIEFKMVEHASDSPYAMLALPTFERLSRSALKMSVLLAAADQKPVNNTIQIDVQHVNAAAHYMHKWGDNSIELIINAGNSVTEKVIGRIQAAIQKYPGILRSTLMQHYHLTKREADEILSTLEERGTVRSQQAGRGRSYWMV